MYPLEPISPQNIWDDYFISKLEEYKGKYSPCHITSTNVSRNNAISPKILKYFLKINSHLCRRYMFESAPQEIIEILVKNKLKDEYYKCWDSCLSTNRNLSLDFVETHPEINWDFNTLSKVIDYKEFLNHGNITLCMSGLSCNPSITMDYIESLINLDWDFYSILANRNLTKKFFTKYFNKFIDYIEDVYIDTMYSGAKQNLSNFEKKKYIIFSKLSINKDFDIDMKFVQKYKKYLDFKWLSDNKYLKFSIVKRIGKIDEWQWRDITINKCITMEDFKNNREYPWCLDALGENPNFDINFFLQEYPEFLEEMKSLKDYESCPIMNSISEHPSVTPEIVHSNRDIPWTPTHILLNTNFTIYNSLEIPDINIRSYFWSMNPNLLFEDIEKHPEINWDYNYIFGSKGGNEFLQEKVNILSRTIAAIKIQRCFRDANYKPTNLLCKIRLMREYNELFGTNYNLEEFLEGVSQV